MHTRFQRITPFLWFDTQAEEAANLYTSIFPNSAITATTRYDKNSAQASGQKAGGVMTVGFQLDGQDFTAINGGPHFKFSEAVSLVINCATQDEIDHYWNALTAGADARTQQCGWLKDKFGLSWQVVPTELSELLGGSGSANVMAALLKMKKLDLAALRRAAG